jgi:hypothetical protein
MIYSLEPKTLEIVLAITETVNTLAIEHNGSVIDQSLARDGSRTEHVLFDPVDLHCRLRISGKTDQDTQIGHDGMITKDAYVSIHQAWINGVLLENWALAELCTFQPEYSQSNLGFARDNGIDLAREITGSLAFHYNGWLEIDLDNFFARYHAVMIKSFEKHNHWVLISNLGHVDQDAKRELRGILTGQ